MTAKEKMEDFLKIIDWLYSINAQFGVDHVVVRGKIYWLDTDKDRQELYELWAESAYHITPR
jgi:hypothetical protein